MDSTDTQEQSYDQKFIPATVAIDMLNKQLIVTIVMLKKKVTVTIVMLNKKDTVTIVMLNKQVYQFTNWLAVTTDV